MTVRALLVLIDDERPLGPQLAGARLWGIPHKLLRELTGGISARHIQRKIEMSDFCDRQTVRWGITVSPEQDQLLPGEGDVMAAIGMMLFGGGGGTGYSPTPSQPAPASQPKAPTPDDAAVEEARRKELAAKQAQVGRGATVLTDYALATTAPSVLKKTLGGA
jgi:hypothetical protein